MSRAISYLPLFLTLTTLCAAPLYAQMGTPPVFAVQPDAPYPEAARTARLGGQVVVDFNIDPSGRTSGVHAVSGPPVLARALQDEIRGWRFVTPLPRDAERSFVADYTFTIFETEEQRAPAAGAAGETFEPGYTAAVSGVVRSADNRQMLDSTPLVRKR